MKLQQAEVKHKTEATRFIVTCSKPFSVGLGEGECRWETEAYGECSETCAGRQSREVFCQCTLPTTEQVRATDDNCVRDDVRLRPIEERSCGIECPEPTTQPPTTQPPTTLTPTTQTPSAGSRMRQSLHAAISY